MSENTAELHITRGIPASGKTTWAKKFVTEGPNRVRVNRDDIREEPVLRERFKKQLGGKKYSEITPFSAYEEQVTIIQHRRIREALQAGKIVLVDDTNLNRRFTKSLLAIAEAEGARVFVKDFPIALDEAKRRNQARDRVVPEFVLDRMYSKLGPNGELPYWDGSYDDQIKPFYAPTERRMAVGFDMDGTLSDTRPIQHFVRGKHRDFDSFHRLSEFTRPNQEVLQAAYDAHENGFAVVVTTARNELYRGVTQKWLDRYEVPYENIFMRPDDDMRPDFVIKKEMFDTWLAPNYDMVRFFDDNIQAIEAWREKGVSVTEVPGFNDTTVPDGWAASVNNPERNIVNPFTSGGRCIRCGRPLADPNELLGPNCRQIR